MSLYEATLEINERPVLVKVNISFEESRKRDEKINYAVSVNVDDFYFYKLYLGKLSKEQLIKDVEIAENTYREAQVEIERSGFIKELIAQGNQPEEVKV